MLGRVVGARVRLSVPSLPLVGFPSTSLCEHFHYTRFQTSPASVGATSETMFNRVSAFIYFYVFMVEGFTMGEVAVDGSPASSGFGVSVENGECFCHDAASAW